MTKRPLYIGDEVSWIVVIVSGTSQNHKMVVVPWQIAVHDDCFTDLHEEEEYYQPSRSPLESMVLTHK